MFLLALLFELPSTYSEKNSSEHSCAIRLNEKKVNIIDKIDFINVGILLSASNLV